MSKGTILVVEDDVALLEGIRDILELDDYTIITASSGIEGLERLREAPHPPDLIVSDIMMPRMDGYQFYEAVREEPSWIAIPFIFLTAKGEKADIRRGKGLGVDDYVTKPFDSEDLMVAVASRLQRARQLGAVKEGEIDVLKSNILTILNHEFRTPLTYVVAYADMLKHDVDDLSTEEFTSYLKGIQSGSERLRRLIENFIFLVELETGEAQQNFQWRKGAFDNYRAAFENVQEANKEAAQGRNVTFKIEVADDLPAIQTAPDYLERALSQLVENGIKFVKPDGGTVTMRATANKQHVILAVEDDGRGIDPEEIDQIFKPFYQINREHYEDQGAGSGLAIVKSIMSLHNGLVEVESTFGEGSTFTLKFPFGEAK